MQTKVVRRMASGVTVTVTTTEVPTLAPREPEDMWEAVRTAILKKADTKRGGGK